MFDFTLLVYIPLIVGSIIGLGFVLMLLSRVGALPIDNPDLLNRVAQNFVTGDKEKAFLILEEDNHPISILMSFVFRLSVKNYQELKDAYEYGANETRRRLTHGTRTLAWLTIAVPIFTVATWLVLPEKPSPRLSSALITAIVAEIIFWNATLFYVNIKADTIVKRADDHFRFLSGIIMGSGGKDTDISGLVDDTQDIVELSSNVDKISDVVAQKSSKESKK